MISAPFLSREAERLAALDDAPAVIGPARDGGYYLLGATRALPVYDAMPWSTDALLDATRARRETPRGAR